MNNGVDFERRFPQRGVFQNLERYVQGRINQGIFYHGSGVDGEWVGFDTSALEVYPDRIRQFHG